MTTALQTTRYEAVIGLEVHVELSTRTKMFCGCATDFGGTPNTRTCPVCLGQPGSLPVINARAVEYAIRLGLALGCEVASSSQFHRKNYFYPDMPKNYQISQYDEPICTGGHLDVETEQGIRRVGITRVHMEEDTGKSLHVGATGRIHGADYSLVDYNRAGIPLLEVVSEPDIRGAAEARAYLTELQAIVRALGISDAKLEEGSMRCDANISVRPVGHTVLGTRVEVKNMNSVRSLGRAVEYETSRQIELICQGQPVLQETRHWDEDAGRTYTLRTKETTQDYRYFPDPDLVVLEPDHAWVRDLSATLPELPAAMRRRLGSTYGLSPAQLATLVDGDLVGVFEDAVAAGAGAVAAVNWLTNEVMSWRNERRARARTVPQASSEAGDQPDITGEQLAELIRLVNDGTLSTKLARQVLTDVLAGRGNPTQIVEQRGYRQLDDATELAGIVEEVIAQQADAAQRVREGNTKAIGALVGAVMRATQGKANPQLVNRLLGERLRPSG